jgi:hypothetical protein
LAPISQAIGLDLQAIIVLGFAADGRALALWPIPSAPAIVVNEVLAMQINQMSSLLIVLQVRTDAVDHHYDESAK